ncbi:MAG: bifunctional methylenetetrahydrofolate dehydrogenase/methenyltetrahydrofolate cyclohydrolase [Planctomycetota bacterium]|nr:MAG: bifunctional methylenetetrahydrofolate dehydrogenase/methenyltetrahydrofolate cyclohydrolase [Planctomycetota bacterium]
MAARVIDGKAIAASMKERIGARAMELREKGRPPSLVAILIGDDQAAASYARSQEKHAKEAGIEFALVRLPTGTTQAEAAEAIERLNRDTSVHGIMPHMPMPRGLDGFELQQRIAPAKDVEGVGATNLGLLAMGRDALAPCTAAAAVECLRSVVPDIAGRDTVVVGRSVIVGKPLAMLLLAANATVTQCHTRTRGLAEHTRSAEILMVAAGVAGLIGAEHVAPGTVVIDVGTHRVTLIDANGKEVTRTVGDVRFDEVLPLASAISPVPGGVGPVTVSMLLENTLRACEKSTS